MSSVVLGPWLDGLRPVRGKLTAPLAAIFRDTRRFKDVHSLATDILADYAADAPDLLAELLMASDSKAYLTLFPVAARRAERIVPVLRAELAKKARFDWCDPPLNANWIKPAASLVRRIEAADGMLDERFAFCQTMPLDEFITTAEALRPSGYRPVRFRPYADDQAMRVAAVWTRDSRTWRIASASLRSKFAARTTTTGPTVSSPETSLAT